ncbi:MAG: type II toxin-antitoxin system prevent-host-death family antitoxin [Chloroflexi bacterium]|nr:type II toxin-antitoxin system prevent-host-death family antitoxin [Chloroflexota bacterium]
MNVGIRELKARLSEYVGKAAAGERIIVTDRGKPVAQLSALDDQTTLERGIEEGWITPARRSGLEPIVPYTSARSTADVLDEDRG